MARTEPAVARPILEGTLTADVEITDPTILLRLTGPSSQYLKIIEREVRAVMGLRGNTIRIQGSAAAVSVKLDSRLVSRPSIVNAATVRRLNFIPSPVSGLAMLHTLFSD